MEKSMRKSTLILAIAPLIFMLGACNNESSKTKAPTNTASNTEAPVARNTLNTVNTIKKRGKLICGVSGELPGFSFLGTDGKYSGIDVDICRAIAVVLFDNPDAVEFRNLNAKERFTALQTGEIDILSRNTTWVLSRDASMGLDFAPVVF